MKQVKRGEQRWRKDLQFYVQPVHLLDSTANL